MQHDIIPSNTISMNAEDVTKGRKDANSELRWWLWVHGESSEERTYVPENNVSTALLHTWCELNWMSARQIPDATLRLSRCSWTSTSRRFNKPWRKYATTMVVGHMCHLINWHAGWLLPDPISMPNNGIHQHRRYPCLEPTSRLGTKISSIL